MTSDLAVLTEDLTKFYGDHCGVEGLNLDVEAGEVMGFLGPNGAGKTTTIRLLLDFVPAIGMDIPLSNVAAAGAGLVALVWCFGGIAFLVGAATGKRATVLAVTGGSAVATYMANAIAGMVDGWHWLILFDRRDIGV